MLVLAWLVSATSFHFPDPSVALLGFMVFMIVAVVAVSCSAAIIASAFAAACFLSHFFLGLSLPLGSTLVEVFLVHGRVDGRVDGLIR